MEAYNRHSNGRDVASQVSLIQISESQNISTQTIHWINSQFRSLEWIITCLLQGCLGNILILKSISARMNLNLTWTWLILLTATRFRTLIVFRSIDLHLVLHAGPCLCKALRLRMWQTAHLLEYEKSSLSSLTHWFMLGGIKCYGTRPWTCSFHCTSTAVNCWFSFYVHCSHYLPH